MAGSNEANEANEANAGSLGRSGGSGFGVLPDRVDLPFIAEDRVDRKRLPPAGWRDRFWAGEWAAWLTLVDFAQTAVLPYVRPTPTVTVVAKTGNVGNGTCTLGAVQASWQTGLYRLRCVSTASNGVFALTDPRGRLLVLAGVGTPVSAEVVFTINTGGTAFAVGDGFDITVSPGDETLWLDAPVAFRSQMPARFSVTASFPASDNKGTCRMAAAQPALHGLGTGTYTLACTAINARATATFQLTYPDGNPSAVSYVVALAKDAKVAVQDEVNCVITSGATPFDAGDKFEIKVRPLTVGIVPKLVGNTGNGTCTYDPDTLAPDNTTIGLWSLRCTDAASGLTFNLYDPDGNVTALTLSGGPPPSARITTPLVLTVTAGSTPFAEGDGFDIDIGGFDEQELRDLVRLAEDERADALGEIIAQHDSFISYFMAAMSISPKTHPSTCLLLHIGSVVGAFVSLHFKGLYQRRRPSQRAPGLLPPVPVPGHPAYPSGHSTQAHLMALCVKQALPDGVRKELGDVLDALADRIARNREIAGLHYGSDSRAGADLAGQILAILTSSSMPLSVPQSVPPDEDPGTGARFKAIVTAAQAEWS